jgi:adenylate cyclase
MGSKPGIRGRFTRQWAAFALLAAAVGGGVYYWDPIFLEGIDLRGRDVAMKLRSLEAPDPRVALVAVDERSVKALGRWPWSRETLARLIRETRRAGAGLIALDIVFPHPEHPKADRLLAEALAGREVPVVLGYFFRGDRGETLASDREASLTKDRLIAGISFPSKERAPLDYSDAETNLPAIRAVASGAGFFNIEHDEDGLIRKSPLVAQYRDGLYPSLAIKALSLYLDEPVGIRLAPFGVEAITVGDMDIPTDERGRLAINYYGPAGTVPTYSAVDLLEGRLPKGALKGRLVFIGVTEIGISDMRATPIDAYFPGVEIHAVVASNILQGRYLIRDTRTILIDWLMVLVLPFLLVNFLVKVRRTIWGVGVFALFIAGVGAVFYLSFAMAGYQVSFTYPVLSLLAAQLLAEGYRNLVIEKRSRFVQRAFSTYVSPALVNQIMRNPERLKLGGEKKVVTILFSDLRGFTALSERLAPEALVSLLNRYLGPMTDVVLSENGTLDKYIGDAIMAIYNAPLDVPDHAARACRSALRMIEELRRLNPVFESEMGLQIEIGVGIHTGEAVVGNMGTSVRFDYTAIGDTVNLTSRLEGQNKYYGTRVLLSEETRSACGEGFLCRPLDLLRVKGKQHPVLLYELLAFAERASPEQQELARGFEAALPLYRQGRFADAYQVFEELGRKFPGDQPTRIYLERCREFMQHPPVPEWDGVYTARTK